MMWKIFFFFLKNYIFETILTLTGLKMLKWLPSINIHFFFVCVNNCNAHLLFVCLVFFLIFDDLHLPDSFYWNENLIWKNQIGSEYLFVCFLVYEQQQKNGLSFFCSAKIYFEFRKCQFFILFLSFLGSISYDTTTNNNNIFGL